MTAPAAVAQEAGSTIDEFEKANRANEGKIDHGMNKGDKEATWFAMADSSDDDALIDKTMSEAGDDEKLDTLLTMNDHWMHDELKLGGSRDEHTASTLNPDAPEFEPHDREKAKVMGSKWPWYIHESPRHGGRHADGSHSRGGPSPQRRPPR